MADDDPSTQSATATARDAGMPAEAPCLPARRLGRYQMLTELGRGGMGVVHLAFDERLNRTVAVKSVQNPRDEGLRHRLREEALAQARVAHPNVVMVHDFDVADDTAFIVMEYVQGETLRAWLGTEPRTVEQILEVFRPAGEGLVAAHDANLVHRDFKPTNVLVTRDGQARVMDFGLATLAPGEDESSAAESGARRASGTPAYMSPEQFARGAVTAASDQFSFCVALYEAIHSERPFPGRGYKELRDSVCAGRVRPMGPRVSSDLRDVLLRGLAVDPAARFESMRALLSALDDVEVVETQAIDVLSEPPRGWLVWELESSEGVRPRHRSYLLEDDGQGSVRVSPAQRPGLFAATPGAFWELRWSQREMINESRQRGEPHEIIPLADAHFMSTSNQVVGLEQGWHPSEWRNEGVDTTDRRFEILASIGSYVFVRSEDFIMYQDAFSCFYSSGFSVIDLARQRSLRLEEFLGRAQVERIGASEEQEANALFEADPDYDPNYKTSVDEDPGLTMVIPEYDEQGQLRLQYQFTRAACRGDSDGAWDVYTMSKRVESRVLVDRLLPFAQLPPAVLAWRAHREQPRHWGWTGITDDHEEWCRALFGVET